MTKSRRVKPASGHPPQGQNAPSSVAKDSQPQLESLLAGIWSRSKQMEIDRVEVLRQAQILASQSRLDDRARLEAAEAAHKLAGALGTFGFHHGTDLARRLEAIFRAGIPSRDSAAGLLGAVEELSAIVHLAKPPHGSPESDRGE